MYRGYIALWRKIQDNPLWDSGEPFPRILAWIDILMEAQHDLAPRPLKLRRKQLTCHYGQVIKSTREWADRWHWSKGNIYRFFAYLAAEKMVELTDETIATRITILNYKRYDPRFAESYLPDPAREIPANPIESGMGHFLPKSEALFQQNAGHFETLLPDDITVDAEYAAEIEGHFLPESRGTFDEKAGSSYNRHKHVFKNVSTSASRIGDPAGSDPPASDVSKSPPPCPQKEIIKLYHEYLPMLTHIKIWPDADQANLRARWREDPDRQNLDWWREFFKRVAESAFLTGQVKAWAADLHWLVKATNFAKVVNGKYHDEDAKKRLYGGKRTSWRDRIS